MNLPPVGWFRLGHSFPGLLYAGSLSTGSSSGLMGAMSQIVPSGCSLTTPSSRAGLRLCFQLKSELSHGRLDTDLDHDPDDRRCMCCRPHPRCSCRCPSPARRITVPKYRASQTEARLCCRLIDSSGSSRSGAGQLSEPVLHGRQQLRACGVTVFRLVSNVVDNRVDRRSFRHGYITSKGAEGI